MQITASKWCWMTDHQQTAAVVQTVEIVPFETEMQDDVEALISEGLAARWGFNDPTLNPDLDNILNYYSSGGMFVALLEDAIVGTGALIAESSKTVRVVRMSVKSNLQGQGIGKKILTHLEHVALERDFDTVVLETTETWRDAVGFYSSRGYEFQYSKDGDAHFLKRLVV